MENKYYTWTKKLFGSKYFVYHNQQMAGNLDESVFSKRSHGNLNGKYYSFNTQGFIKLRTHIIDNLINTKIGEINFNGLMNRAIININNKMYIWQNDNILNTRWKIFNNEGTLIQYSGSSTSGHFISNTDDESLLLSGFCI